LALWGKEILAWIEETDPLLDAETCVEHDDEQEFYLTDMLP
jgi:hypothetical protein